MVLRSWLSFFRARLFWHLWTNFCSRKPHFRNGCKLKPFKLALKKRARPRLRRQRHAAFGESLEQRTLLSGTPAEISTIGLANDTGLPGDRVTGDATLTGGVNNPDGLTNLIVEFDFEGNGSYFTTSSVDANGSFTIDPTPELLSGLWDVTVDVVGDDPDTGLMVYSEPAYFDFTLESPSGSASPATVTFIGLANDTGSPGDNITTDGTDPGVRRSADCSS